MDERPARPALTARQAKTLAALLRHPSVRSAAQAVKVPERTVRSWLRDNADFRKEYTRLAGELMETGLRNVQALTGQAAQVLRRALRCSDAKVSVRAALGILDRAVRAAELLELSERVEA